MNTTAPRWFERFTSDYPQARPIMRQIVALEQADAGDSDEAITLKSELARLRADYEDRTDDVLAKDGHFIAYQRRQQLGVSA